MSNPTYSLYPYEPTKVAPVLFAALFFVSGLCHVYQTIKYKSWRFTALLPWAALCFLAGFVIQVISTYNQQDLGFLIAVTVLLFAAPPIFAGANYFILGRILHYIPYLSPIHPGRVVSTFVGLDVIVEVLTGQGAWRLSKYSDPKSVKVGSALIKASLLLQLVISIGFIAVEINFHLRAIRAHVMTPKLARIITVLYVSNALILARNIYRTIDTWQGRDGYIHNHEVFLYIFDGVLMIANSVMMNIWHPSQSLPKSNKTYLANDGRTELLGPGYVDKRNFFVTLFDPFDIYGLLTGKDKATAFWETAEEQRMQVATAEEDTSV